MLISKTDWKLKLKLCWYKNKIEWGCGEEFKCACTHTNYILPSNLEIVFCPPLLLPSFVTNCPTPPKSNKECSNQIGQENKKVAAGSNYLTHKIWAKSMQKIRANPCKSMQKNYLTVFGHFWWFWPTLDVNRTQV